MGNQLYWEDLIEGSEMPSLAKKPSTRQIVMWAGAVDQYGESHYDKDFALSRGLPGVILHGSMKGAFLMQMLTDHIGPEGVIRRISYNDRRLDFPGKTIICRARVIRKYEEDSEARVDCEIWTENEEGEKTVEGSAVLSLPRRR